MTSLQMRRNFLYFKSRTESCVGWLQPESWQCQSRSFMASPEPEELFGAHLLNIVRQVVLSYILPVVGSSHEIVIVTRHLSRYLVLVGEGFYPSPGALNALKFQLSSVLSSKLIFILPCTGKELKWINASIIQPTSVILGVIAINASLAHGYICGATRKIELSTVVMICEIGLWNHYSLLMLWALVIFFFFFFSIDTKNLIFKS